MTDVEPTHDSIDLAALTGVAELMADVATSFADERATATLAEQIVAGAVAIIPGVAAAAVLTVTASGTLESPLMEGDAAARSVMDAQNDAGGGPCLDSWRDDKQIWVTDLEAELRWPGFTAAALELDFRSMVCTPMEISGRRIGVLSLVGREANFGGDADDTETLARIFAQHAGVAMSGARRVDEVNRALTNRDVIGQAKGILMERFKVTPDVAFAMLVRASSRTNSKLRTVCEQLCLTGVLLDRQPRA
ncbi:GAF and ANTAR domain-containing protein [Nakamurella alba]|uniref:GAF and ANTAR domain-containing protein n=1 Tax=Nakamurella alba TaxID=2665158 RepID=UPI0018AAB77E|nr:GAF and ANTAR domain-containing protein [Nakamurella alba]